MSTAIPAEKLLGQRVLFGASWSAIARITIQVSALAASTIVARRVPPYAFGIVGMATLAIGVVSLFHDLGIASAVIQKRELNLDCSFAQSPEPVSFLIGVSPSIHFHGT